MSKGRFRKKRKARTCRWDLLPGMLKPAQAAALLNCSVKTLRRRNIVPFRDQGLIRYHKDQIREYIKQCTQDAKPQEKPRSTLFQERRAARRSGSLAALSLLEGATAKSSRDQLSEALALTSELRAKGSRSARNGTGSTNSSSKSRGARSRSLVPT